MNLLSLDPRPFWPHIGLVICSVVSRWNAMDFKYSELHFQILIFNATGQILLQFENFHSLPVIRRTQNAGWLMWHSFSHQHLRQHSSAQEISRKCFSPDPRVARRVWGQTSLVPRPNPIFCSSVCVEYNTRRQKSAKDGEGLGTLVT